MRWGAMEYLHKELELSAGDVVEVTLSGNAANVMLLDPDNFQKYKQGEQYHNYGGYVRTSPYRVQPPHGGKWHLVVDLGGASGRVQASVRVINGVLS
jgi:hypothetical protein